MEFNKLVSSIESVNVDLRRNAVQEVNHALAIRNWLIGAYIVEYEQHGEDRAKYGEYLLKNLSKALSKKGLKGFSDKNIERYRTLYLVYPQISTTVSSKLQHHDFIDKSQIRLTMSAESQYSPDINLMLKHFTFSHFLELIKADTPVKRAFYEIHAIKGNWTVRQLRRQMESLLYERTGLSKNKEALIAKINSTPDEISIEDTLKDPYVLEFTGLKECSEYSENDLETALLDHIQEFLLELGTGFCFEARQKRITIGTEHDRIDLVFYHRVLKCHVLIDLKTRAFTNADAGQMNFYLNYFKANEIKEGDNPPVGLILCTNKDDIKVRYALGGIENSLFISKYLLQLPSEKDIIEYIKKLELT
jgi:predicted nuclease of restriction endonuclease-like (RecB) superfamily